MTQIKRSDRMVGSNDPDQGSIGRKTQIENMKEDEKDHKEKTNT